MVSQDLQNQNQIEEFIYTQVVSRGLDERTAKAYQIDLELFYLWIERMEGSAEELLGQVPAVYLLFGENLSPVNKIGYEEWMEAYLHYLMEEKRLRFSTINRKQRVLRYYLSYLKTKGIVDGCRPLKVVNQLSQGENQKDTDKPYLTKKEIDAFFQAIQKEYRELNSDFRKRVCLRDQVMMRLLFYHRVEVSELLRMEVRDYDRKTMVLTVHRKREKERQIYLFSKALQREMVQWLNEHEYFEHGGEHDNRMFLSKLGKPLSMKMVINIFDKYRIKAGITKECTPKDLKNGLGRYAEEVVREISNGDNWELYSQS